MRTCRIGWHLYGKKERTTIRKTPSFLAVFYNGEGGMSHNLNQAMLTSYQHLRQLEMLRKYCAALRSSQARRAIIRFVTRAA